MFVIGCVCYLTVFYIISVMTNRMLIVKITQKNPKYTFGLGPSSWNDVEARPTDPCELKGGLRLRRADGRPAVANWHWTANIFWILLCDIFLL